jgi:hypothetical protein
MSSGKTYGFVATATLLSAGTTFVSDAPAYAHDVSVDSPAGHGYVLSRHGVGHGDGLLCANGTAPVSGYFWTTGGILFRAHDRDRDCEFYTFGGSRVTGLVACDITGCTDVKSV